MWQDIRAIWALLFGVGFMMLGNGLQGTLLGLRAIYEGFSTSVTGIMMSGYFIGMFLGSLLAPQLVSRVGHIRVFAALASAASIAILVHAVFINPVTWTLMRLVTGISYAGLYVVSESWLNDRASNETRGKLLSIYMVITTLGMGGGQFLLNLADPIDPDLFILVSAIVSLGLIPILLTVRPAPVFGAAEKMSVVELYRASPLGVIATVFTGMAHGTIFGLGAVYAARKGFSTEQVSIFMACFLFGGLIFQWPIGFVSDYIDRRRVMAAIALSSAVLAVVILLVPPASVIFYVLTVLLGGASIPMYSMCVAYINDRLEPGQIVAASGGIVMVIGIGLSTGPVAISFVMQFLGPEFFFVGIAMSLAMIFLFAIYRMGQRAAVEVEDQGPMFATGEVGTPVAEIIAPDAVDYVEAVISGDVESLDEPSDDVERKL